jgi:hypothetical protein
MIKSCYKKETKWLCKKYILWKKNMNKKKEDPYLWQEMSKIIK